MFGLVGKEAYIQLDHTQKSSSELLPQFFVKSAVGQKLGWSLVTHVIQSPSRCRYANEIDSLNRESETFNAGNPARHHQTPMLILV